MTEKEIKLECLKMAMKYAFNEKDILELAKRFYSFIKN
jgi:hypothetical protein